MTMKPLTAMMRMNGRILRFCRDCWNLHRRTKRFEPTDEGLHVCKKCGEEKGAMEFPVMRSCRTGRHPYCKPCWNAYNLERSMRARADMGTLFWNRRATDIKAKAKKRGEETDISGEELRVAFEATDGRCPYCGIPLEAENLHLDHDVPVSRGGKTCIGNLRFICGDCNQFKLNLTGAEFLEVVSQYGAHVMRNLSYVIGQLRIERGSRTT